MTVIVLRGLPGSPTIGVARSIFNRPTDYVIDLTKYHETDQGNLFVTESLPDEAEDHVQRALRSQDVSRLAICASAHKGWIEEVIRSCEIDPDEVHWLVVEGAEKPESAPKKLYQRLAKSFEVDLYV